MYKNLLQLFACLATPIQKAFTANDDHVWSLAL